MTRRAERRRLFLGTFPTPVMRVASAGSGDSFGERERLWVKRDDLDATLYGGNKVRKLEYLLGDATELGRHRIVTLGAVGSHQVVATAIYGRQAGFEVEAVLVAQPWNAAAEDNIRAALAQGLRPIVAPSWGAAPALLAALAGRGKGSPYLVPLGGSNALGSLGFIDAARELAAQIGAGEMPEPDEVVVAMGSGGTAAGLAVGFEELGMRTRVVGVAISAPVALVGAMARRVARKTAELVGLSRAQAVSAVERIVVERGWLGKGYGYSTSEGDAATRRAASEGITLDPTYTAKAFACALDRTSDARSSGGCVLYWHTLSGAPIAPFVADAPPLPPGIRRLFR